MLPNTSSAGKECPGDGEAPGDKLRRGRGDPPLRSATLHQELERAEGQNFSFDLDIAGGYGKRRHIGVERPLSELRMEDESSLPTHRNSEEASVSGYHISTLPHNFGPGSLSAGELTGGPSNTQLPKIGPRSREDMLAINEEQGDKIEEAGSTDKSNEIRQADEATSATKEAPKYYVPPRVNIGSWSAWKVRQYLRGWTSVVPEPSLTRTEMAALVYESCKDEDGDGDDQADEAFCRADEYLRTHLDPPDIGSATATAKKSLYRKKREIKLGVRERALTQWLEELGQKRVAGGDF